MSQECLSLGMEYQGDQVILPGYVLNEKDCQTQCWLTVYCSYFTWKAQGNASAPHGPGACLKFNDQATLVPIAANAPGGINGTISGPKVCPGLNTTTMMPTVPVAPVVPGIPTPASLPGNGTATNGTVNVTNITDSAKALVEHMGGGGGFPWWAIALIALVVAGVCAGVLFGMRDGKSKKTKRSGKVKKSKKESRSTMAAVEAGESAALMRTEAPPPVVENVMVENVVMPPPAAMPAPPMPELQMAAPVATNMMAFQQPMAAYMQPQVVQMQQVPVVQTVLQPQFR